MEQQTRVCISIAVGYRHIDCASIYGNQKLVGEGLADLIKEVGENSDVLPEVVKDWSFTYLNRKLTAQSMMILGPAL